MAQKREIEFDSIYGGMGSVDEDEMLSGNKDLLTKDERELLKEQIKLKESMELKAERELEINGKEYHISF